jgi:hypothetical protein
VVMVVVMVVVVEGRLGGQPVPVATCPGRR